MKRIILHTMMIGLFLSSISIAQVHAQKVGDPAPDFSLQTLDGKTFTLSVHKGKVVFIFLFGNNCPHCIANAPNTQLIYETYMSDPEFVAIAIDVWNGNASSVQSFKNRTGLTYPVAIDGASLTSTYSSSYDRILVVDQEGKLHYKALSNATTGLTSIVAEQLEALLTGSTGVGDSEVSQREFSVYPNPIHDQANVQSGFESGKLVHLSLVDMSGRVVQSESFIADQTGSITLNLSNHPSGVYYLRARSEEKAKGLRVVLSN